MKYLPIGIQSFNIIREENYYYVDKTGFLYDLVKEGGKYYFLSRPRRFGKSLFVDTLNRAFLGQKEYFKGLYLENRWDWSISYPVISISFGAGVIRDRDDLDVKFDYLLKTHARNLGVELTFKTVREQFLELIENAAKSHQQKVVVLVDEYDKPILDNINNPDLAIEMREGLKNFYSVIKDSDQYIKFVFITGVSKFSKVSLFSGLNNLEDITLNSSFGAICGYTEEELTEVFSDILDGVDMTKVRTWYNGYNWLGKRVYNPFDILLFLKNREFKNYWFETGTPSFLIKLIQERHFLIPDLECMEASEGLLGSFDVNEIHIEALLFQTGYLTIVRKRHLGERIQYTLSYPNLEVRISLIDYILNFLCRDVVKKERNQLRIFDALHSGNLDNLRDIFYSFFASIPHDWYRKNRIEKYEGYYASIFYCYFTALGLDVVCEDTTNRGRIDLSVTIENKIYIFEFKVTDIDIYAGKALLQIKKKKYHEKYLDAGKRIYLVGVEFNSAERNISAVEWETVDMTQFR